VDRHVRHKNPSASPSEVQNETDDGLFRLGAVGERDERFVARKRSLDQSIHKISHEYVKHYDDPERWMFSAWLSLTGKGELRTRSIDEKDIEGYRGRAT
jgi:hypothetical protein